MQWMEEELKQKKWRVYYLLNSSGKLLSDFLANFHHTDKHTNTRTRTSMHAYTHTHTGTSLNYIHFKFVDFE